MGKQKTTYSLSRTTDLVACRSWVNWVNIPIIIPTTWAQWSIKVINQWKVEVRNGFLRGLWGGQIFTWKIPGHARTRILHHPAGRSCVTWKVLWIIWLGWVAVPIKVAKYLHLCGGVSPRSLTGFYTHCLLRRSTLTAPRTLPGKLNYATYLIIFIKLEYERL